MVIGNLQQLWQHDDIVISCHRPAGLEDQPDLALRVRGALGNVLETLCDYPRARPDPFDREGAHELLYYWSAPKIQTCFGPLELAVPWVIRAMMTSDTVMVTVRLFGEAGIHRPLVEAALILALEGGISLRNHAIRVPLPLKEVDWHRFDGGAQIWQKAATSVLLRFHSPLVIRSGNNIRLEPTAALRSAYRRVAMIAPWMGFALAAEERALMKSIDNVKFDLDIHPEHWVRTSRRDPGKHIKVFGYGGSITCYGPLESLLPFLQLAELAGLGGECASGFGAFELICYP